MLVAQNALVQAIFVVVGPLEKRRARLLGSTSCFGKNRTVVQSSWTCLVRPVNALALEDTAIIGCCQRLGLLSGWQLSLDCIT